MSLRQWLFNGVAGAIASNGNANVLSEDGVVATTVTGSGMLTFQEPSQEGTTSLRFLGNGVTPPIARLPFVAINRTGALSYYHRAATLPPSTINILNVRHASGDILRVAITASGAVQVANSAGVEQALSPGGVWAINRQNRIEVLFSNAGGVGAGTFTVAIFDGESTTALSTLSMSTVDMGVADVVNIDIGSPQQATTWEHYFDSVQMNDGATTFIGPYVASDPLVVVPPAPVTVGPGESTELVASLSSGTADTWTWRQISGPAVSFADAGATLLVEGPSVWPPDPSVAMFGVTASLGDEVSAEVTVNVTILPQISWTRAPGGDWTGSRVAPA